MFLRTIIIQKLSRPYNRANAIVICKPGSFRLKHGVGNISRITYTNKSPIKSYQLANIIEHGNLNFQTYEQNGNIYSNSHYKQWILSNATHTIIEFTKNNNKYFIKHHNNHNHINDMALIFNMCAYSSIYNFVKHDIYTEIPLKLHPNMTKLLKDLGIRNIYTIFS